MWAERAPTLTLTATLVISGLWWATGLPTGWVLFIPWALSVLLFGLPHGAADHVIWASLRREHDRFVPVIGRYLLVMAVYVAVWWVSPSIAVAIFLGITIWHWGSADATRSFERADGTVMNAPWIVASLSRGIVPMVAPLAFYADVVAGIIAGLSSDLAQADVMTWIPETNAILAFVLASQVIWLATMYRIGAPFRTEMLETLLNTLLLVAVHPLVSVGVYFTFWHAWHHDRRLSNWYANAQNGIQRRSKRRDQLGIMAVTLIGMVALVMAMPPVLTTLSIYLIAISILTMPHMIVVWLMDRRYASIVNQRAG